MTREAQKVPASNALTTLPVAMTGRASPAKAAVGDKPVFAYIRMIYATAREHGWRLVTKDRHLLGHDPERGVALW